MKAGTTCRTVTSISEALTWHKVHGQLLQRWLLARTVRSGVDRQMTSSAAEVRD